MLGLKLNHVNKRGPDVVAPNTAKTPIITVLNKKIRHILFQVLITICAHIADRFFATQQISVISPHGSP